MQASLDQWTSEVVRRACRTKMVSRGRLPTLALHVSLAHSNGAQESRRDPGIYREKSRDMFGSIWLLESTEADMELFSSV